MIEKIYKKAIYALARVAVKYIELRKKREQKKIKQNKSANLTNSTKSYTDAEYNKKVVAEIIITILQLLQKAKIILM